MSPPLRAVITGLGTVSALGNNHARFFDALFSSKTALKHTVLFGEEHFPKACLATVEFDPTTDPPLPYPIDARSEKMAVFAAKQACEMAKWTSLADVDLIVGASTGGLVESEREIVQLFAGDPNALSAKQAKGHPISSAADCIHQTIGPVRSTITVCSACATGAIALGIALARIRSGKSKRVLVGAVDSLCRLTLAGFSSLASLDPDPCRPFATNRKGLNLGEGSAFFAIEALTAEELALWANGPTENKTILAELLGFSATNEAHHITHPDPSGTYAKSVMQQAVESAGLSLDDISYISAHGTATPLNDAMESQAINALFEGKTKPYVSSQKAQFGHTLAAAGALESAACVLAVYHNRLPPQVGTTAQSQAPDCPVQLAPIESDPHSPSVRATLSNSFGFGGSNAAVVLGTPGLGDLSSLRQGPDTRTSARYVLSSCSTISPLGKLSNDAAKKLAVRLPFRAAEVLPPSSITEPTLDTTRSRRFDLAARWTTALIQELISPSQIDHNRTGIVSGSAFGGAETSAKFVQRILQRGPHFASPADFPGLVPSAAASQAAIYHSLHGPVLSVANLALTPISSIQACLDLFGIGTVDHMLSVSLEAYNSIIETTLSTHCSLTSTRSRSTGGAAFLIEPIRSIFSDSPTIPNASQLIRQVELVNAETFTQRPAAPWRANSPSSAVFIPDNSPDYLSLVNTLGLSNHTLYTLAPEVAIHEASVGLCIAAAWANIHDASEQSAIVLGLTPSGWGYVELANFTGSELAPPLPPAVIPRSKATKESLDVPKPPIPITHVPFIHRYNERSSAVHHLCPLAPNGPHLQGGKSSVPNLG